MKRYISIAALSLSVVAHILVIVSDDVRPTDSSNSYRSWGSNSGGFGGGYSGGHK